MKKIKMLKITTGLLLTLLIILALLSLLVPDIVPSKPENSKESYSQMSAYVALLEAYSLQQKTRLSCDASSESGQAFQDQWNRDLHCSFDEKSLYIRSAGPDGRFDTKDDLIVRRMIK